MANKKEDKKKIPLVNSLATQMKKTIVNNHDTNPTTPEQTKLRKGKLLAILDKTSDTFLKNLENGEAEVRTTSDLERIVKLTLLLSGEADTIQGKQNQTEVIDASATSSHKVSMSKIDQILDLNDPSVKKVLDMLTEGYNDINDAYEDKDE